MNLKHLFWPRLGLARARSRAILKIYVFYEVPAWVARVAFDLRW